MLLSVQQRYMLELLRNVGCLRKGQMLAFLQQRYEKEGVHISEQRLEVMLRQLRNCAGELRLEGDLVRLDSAKPDAYWMEAIDVMLELAGRAAPQYKARLPPPLLLRFVLDDDAGNIFAVVAWKDRSTALPVLAKQGEQRVIWLWDSKRPAAGVSLPPGHFLAVRKEDGTHRFFGPENT